jgi:hypothetical protein
MGTGATQVSTRVRFADAFQRIGVGRNGTADWSPRIFAASLALAFFLIASAPANALVSGHIYVSSMGGGLGSENGQFGNAAGTIFGMGVAVDQSNGDVFVTDPHSARVQKFNAAGEFLQAWGYGVSNGANERQVCNAPAACQAGIPGAAPGQFDHPTSIAIDNSGGESDGDVYVADTSTPVGGGSNYIHKFKSDGTYIGRINGSETPGGVFTSLTYRGAMAVDGEGFLWVADGGRLIKFTSEVDNEYVGGSEFNFGSITSLAVNSAGTRLYVIAGYAGVFRLAANGSTSEEIFPAGTGESIFAIGENPWIGVDPVTDHAYLAGGDQIREIGLDNKPAAPNFGPPDLGNLGVNGGLAVKESTGVVYVADTGAGKVLAFAPRTVPDVATAAPTNIGTEGATLNGQVGPEAAGGGDVSDCHFEIGTDTSYGTSVPCEQATPYSSPTVVSADVSGLPAEMTYHYRLVAANSVDANQGEDRTFTLHSVLGITTDPATNPTPDGLTLNGSFEPAEAATHYYFEWGLDSSYGNTTSTPPGDDVVSGTGTKHVAVQLNGLSSYRKYHYRIVATNSIGTSYGEDAIATTEPPFLPVVSGTYSGAATDRSATVGASINPRFGDTVYTFEYGPSESYGQETPLSSAIGADDLNHPVVAELSNLDPGTTYHFRAVAINFGGTTHGTDQTFTTQDAPSIESLGASAVTQTTATIVASINPKLSATTYSFEFGTGPSYGSSTPPTELAADGLGHTASASLSGLTPNTTYHFRAVADNGVGRSVGADQTFTTAPLPPVQAQARPLTCRKKFVKKRGKCVKRGPGKHRHGQKKRGQGSGR